MLFIFLKAATKKIVQKYTKKRHGDLNGTLKNNTKKAILEKDESNKVLRHMKTNHKMTY